MKTIQSILASRLTAVALVVFILAAFSGCSKSDDELDPIAVDKAKLCRTWVPVQPNKGWKEITFNSSGSGWVVTQLGDTREFDWYINTKGIIYGEMWWVYDKTVQRQDIRWTYAVKDSTLYLESYKYKRE